MLFRTAKFFLYASVFAVVIVTTSTLFPFIVGKYVWFRVTVDIALVAFLCGIALTPGSPYEARLRALAKHPLAIAVTVFAAVFVIAGFFGVDPANSFWSNFERGEGGMQILHLWLFFALLALLFRDEEDWHRLFLLVLVASVGMILYGFGAHLKYVDAETVPRQVGDGLVYDLTGKGGAFFRTFRSFIGSSFHDVVFRFSGSIGNPAYVAAYLIFSLFYGSYLLLTRYRGRLRSWGGVMIILTCVAFVLVFFWTATRGGLIGLVGGLLAAAAYLAYRNKRARPWLLGAALAGILGVFVLTELRQSGFLKNLPGGRIFDISFSAETFRARTMVWKTALDGAAARPLFGWGPENFMYVFTQKFNTNKFNPAEGFGAWFDRAHSVFFDYLAETGILGLASYLAVFAAWTWAFFKRSGGLSPLSRALLLVVPVAYLIQGLVLFDVLVIYINLFLFLAFSVYLFWPPPAPSGTPSAARGALPDAGRWTLVGAGIAFAAFALVYGAWMPLVKSRRYIAASRAITSVRTLGEFTKMFDGVLDFPSPVGQEEVVRFLGNDIMNIISAETPQPDEVSRALVSYIEPRFFTNDARHVLLGAGMHFTLWRRYGREDDYATAERYLRKGLETNPKLPPFLYSLFDLYRLKGDTRGAAEVGKTILGYWPNDERVARIVGNL